MHLQHNRYYVVEPSGDGRKSDMSKGKELTGQRFGKLTAVEATDERKTVTLSGAAAVTAEKKYT